MQYLPTLTCLQSGEVWACTGNHHPHTYSKSLKQVIIKHQSFFYEKTGKKRYLSTLWLNAASGKIQPEKAQGTFLLPLFPPRMFWRQCSQYIWSESHVGPRQQLITVTWCWTKRLMINKKIQYSSNSFACLPHSVSLYPSPANWLFPTPEIPAWLYSESGPLAQGCDFPRQYSSTFFISRC